jgi:hypothetical protein
MDVSAFLGSKRLAVNLKTCMVRCLQTAEQQTTKLQTVTVQPHRGTTMAPCMRRNSGSWLFNASWRRLWMEPKNWRLAYPREQCSSTIHACSTAAQNHHSVLYTANSYGLSVVTSPFVCTVQPYDSGWNRIGTSPIVSVQGGWKDDKQIIWTTKCGRNLCTSRTCRIWEHSKEIGYHHRCFRHCKCSNTPF